VVVVDVVVSRTHGTRPGGVIAAVTPVQDSVDELVVTDYVCPG
jgi:hypothetical protein